MGLLDRASAEWTKLAEASPPNAPHALRARMRLDRLSSRGLG